jgi:hypothetical protein
VIQFRLARPASPEGRTKDGQKKLEERAAPRGTALLPEFGVRAIL